MIRFLYKQSYDTPANGTVSDGMHHILVYALADKYDTPFLKPLTARKFKAIALEDWD